MMYSYYKSQILLIYASIFNIIATFNKFKYCAIPDWLSEYSISKVKWPGLVHKWTNRLSSMLFSNFKLFWKFLDWMTLWFYVFEPIMSNFKHGRHKNKKNKLWCQKKMKNTNKADINIQIQWTLNKLARFCYFSSNKFISIWLPPSKRAHIAQYRIDSRSTALYILLVKSNDQAFT